MENLRDVWNSNESFFQKKQGCEQYNAKSWENTSVTAWKKF